MNEIKKGDWIEVRFVIQDCVNEVKVLGFNEKGIEIYDEWNKHLLEWRDIDSIKKLDDEEKG